MSSGEAETLKYKTWVLKVLIHCHGCAREVRKVLQAIDGVFRTVVDAQQHRVTVIGDVEVEVLIRKLMKIGKRAELWPCQEKDKEKKKGKEKSHGNEKTEKHQDEQKKGSKKKGKKQSEGGGGATTVGDHHDKVGDGGGELGLVQQQKHQHNVWQQLPVEVFLPNPACNNVSPIAPPPCWFYTPTPLPPEQAPKFHARWCPYSGDVGGGRSCSVCSDENVAACRVM